MPKSITRREFIKVSAMNAGAVVASEALAGYTDLYSQPVDFAADVNVGTSFMHGVASGDPTRNSVILWTRVTPEQPAVIPISWMLATDESFDEITHQGTTVTSAETDYTVKVDVRGLAPERRYYYRFKSPTAISPTGRTKTLPKAFVEQVKLAAFSCANLPFGYFHVYRAAAEMDDIDVALHLGDYIYEYERGRYPKAADTMAGREFQPAHEITELADYRARYRQCRGDKDLQALHASVPFICVWDDHEIANNAWRHGAENHNAGEGSFVARSKAALQAYFEWLPVRPRRGRGKAARLYRSFNFGRLLSLHMLDTRFIGRSKQLEYADYTDAKTAEFDDERFYQDQANPKRRLLGSEQLAWLGARIKQSKASWQVLGQQVLMGNYRLPRPLILNNMDIREVLALQRLLRIKQKIDNQGTAATTQERRFYKTHAAKLTPEAVHALQAKPLPIRLDSWDGYHHDREAVYRLMQRSDSSFVVLGGDTHNAWASNLMRDDGAKVALEFATASVTSPGIAEYVRLASKGVPAMEASLVNLIKNLEYTNINDRGFMTVTFSHSDTKAEWHFVSSVKQKSYHLLVDRHHAVTADRKTIVMQTAS